MNLGDEVAVVESAEGGPVATHTISESGDETFRVYFAESRGGGRRSPLAGAMVELEPQGCWFDVYAPGLVAVSAPRLSAEDVFAYLAGRERRGELRFEKGRSA